MKQITHKQARFEVGLCISAYDMNERLNAEQELYKYITQQEKKDIMAQKEHELVVIYSNVPFTMISHLFRDEDIQRIDELEKELEALK